MRTIKDNGEPLVDLSKFCPKLKFDLDQDRKKLEKTAYARKTVAEKLNRAITLLPAGLTFKLADAWRPQYIQDKYFRWYILFLTKKYPSWNNERVITETKKYVHPSKGERASGHLTGGALDISLCYLKNGKDFLSNQANCLFKKTLSLSSLNFQNTFKQIEKLCSMP